MINKRGTMIGKAMTSIPVIILLVVLIAGYWFGAYSARALKGDQTPQGEGVFLSDDFLFNKINMEIGGVNRDIYVIDAIIPIRSFLTISNRAGLRHYTDAQNQKYVDNFKAGLKNLLTNEKDCLVLRVKRFDATGMADPYLVYWSTTLDGEVRTDKDYELAGIGLERIIIDFPENGGRLEFNYYQGGCPKKTGQV